MKLTDAKVKNLKAKARPYKLSDGKGLYLFVTPTGSKMWRYKYRFETREKTLSCGTYPEISLSKARERLLQARSLLSESTDPALTLPLEWQPSKALQEEKQLFKNLANEWYEKVKGKWSESHAERVWQRLEYKILPVIGEMKSVDIQAQDCLRVIQKVEATGALDVAGRVRGFMRNIFDYGMMTGQVKHNPALPLNGVITQRKVTHRKALKREELPKFLKALEADRKIHPVTKAATWIQVYTFLRPGEIRHGLWSEIDWKKKQWHIPGVRIHPYTDKEMLGMKMKHQDHIVPLANQVIDVLKELQKLTGNYKFMFPGYHDFRKPLSENAVRLAIQKRLKFDSTAHGFRAVARTILDEELGFRPDIIEHQLHHAVRDPNGRAYNRTTYLEQRTKMMQVWADWLENCLKDN